MKNRTLIWVAILSFWIFGGLNEGLAKDIAIFGAQPDFLLVATVVISMLSDMRGAAVAGFTGGFFQGAITGANMWQYVVTRLIVGWIGGSLIELRFQRNAMIAAMACFVASIIAGLVFLFLTSQPNILGSLRDTLISAMYNAVLAALVFAPVEKLSGVKTRQ
jgi:rod shape-determining protein MreD